MAMFAILHALGMFVVDLFKSRSRLLKLGASFYCFNSTVLDQ